MSRASDYVYAMGHILAHVHFADTDRLAPGEGALRLGRRLQALKEVSFTAMSPWRSASTRDGPSPTAMRGAR